MLLRPFILNIKSKNVACASQFILSYKKTNNYSTYGASKPELDPEHYTKYEIVKNPEEWKYVERYLPKSLIPEPPKQDYYPSGWTPVKANPDEHPYFIERTKNHLIPVYLRLSHRGQMKVTKVRRISGDIWLLKSDLFQYLKNLYKKPIGVQVDELAGIISFRGDFVSDIQDWLLKRGF